MKTFYFEKKDSIHKMFQVLDKIPSKYKEVIFDINVDNEFFQNKRFLKVILEKATSKDIKLVFMIESQKQEAFLKTFHTPYVRRKTPLYKKGFKIFKDFLDNFKDNNSFYKKHYNVFKIVFLLLEISFVAFIFIFIYNLVVPKTDVYIQPNVKIKQLIQKFYIYPDGEKDKYDVSKRPNFPYHEKSFTVNYETKIPVKDISYISKPSSGRIKFYNKTTEGISLKSRTEMMTEDGLLFRLNNWVYIPPRDENSQPGIAFVDVTAQEEDEKGNLMGVAGNLTKGQKLFIKKMYVSIGQKQIYAEVEKNFSGGETNSNGTVQVEDIDLVKNTLLKKFQNNLKQSISINIQEDGNKQIPIISEDSYGYNDILYKIDAKPGEKKSFIKGNIQGNIYFKYIDKSILKEAFKNYLDDRIITKNEFLGWDDNTVHLIALTKINKGVDLVTFSISALLGYDYSDDYNGIKNRIKQEIRGKTIQDAKNIILSNPDVAGAEIHTTNTQQRVSDIVSRIFIHITN